MSLDLLNNVVLLLLISTTILFIFSKLHLPSALGYLFAGVLIGPEAFNIISTHTDIESLSELGIILMLFMIGLEFSWVQFKTDIKPILTTGVTYIVSITGIVAIAILTLSNLSLGEAFIIGGAIAMSSTALVSKQLIEQKEFYTTHGKRSFNLVLFQDLATLVFLVTIPSLAKNGSSQELIISLSYSIITMIAVFIGIYFIGKKIERPIMRIAGAIKSSEIFILTILLIIIGAAWVSRYFNLPETIGVFIAGMIIGETEFKYKVEEDIRPFRDIFVGLFFMSMGMMIEISSLSTHIYLIISIVVSIMFGKFFITSAIAFMTGSNIRDSSRIGLILSHCGEFSLLLILLGMKSHIISNSLGQILMASFLISTMLSTVLIMYNNKIVFFIFKALRIKHTHTESILKNRISNNLTNHIIICGFGETGKSLDKFLKPSGINTVIIDMDSKKVEEAINNNSLAIYGDASNLKTLKILNIDNAKALIITFDEYAQTMKILYKVRSEYPKLPIIVRTHHINHVHDMILFGATAVLPDGMGTGIALGKEIIKHLEIPEVIVESSEKV